MKITTFFFLLTTLFTPLLWGAEYRAPIALGLHQKNILMAEQGTKTISFINMDNGTITSKLSLPAAPNAMLIDGDTAYVSVGGTRGKLLIIDIPSQKITNDIKLGHTPLTPHKRKDRLYVPVRFSNHIAVIDLKNKKVIETLAAQREPIAVQTSLDGKTIWIANHLPAGRADGESSSASLTQIKNGKTTHFPLSNGAQGARGMTMSPDGKYLALSHILSRYQVPTTQLNKGWINTNALSLIHTEQPEKIDCILLDDVDFGAANPWALAFSPDGKTLLVSHAGIHEISIIDMPALLTKIESSKQKKENVNQLSFLNGVRTRQPLPLNGPRSLIVNNTHAYVAGYFSDNIVQFALDTPDKVTAWTFANADTPSPQRRGEQYFNDASLCFQAWESCASCHPDARVDGFNWDLLNDGMGNPKNTRTMFLAHRSSPVMTLGIRKNAEIAVKAGFRHIQFVEPTQEHTDCVDAYLREMPTVPSPFLVADKLSKTQDKDKSCQQCHDKNLERGSLSASAKKGSKIFKEAGCVECHPHPYFTTKKLCDVGTLKGVDEGKKLVVPSLVEVWRTAPYFHDGRATTLKEVITIHNKDNKRGKTNTLSPKEIENLVDYVKSL